MTELELGDLVVYVGDARHAQWGIRKDTQLIGKVINPGDNLPQAQILFGGTTAPSWSKTENLHKIGKSDWVTGQVYGSNTRTVTGTYVGRCTEECTRVLVPGSRFGQCVRTSTLTWVRESPVTGASAPVETKKEIEVTEQEFIGQAVPGPKYVTPFSSDGDTVRDGNGTFVVSVDLDHNYDPGDDDLMAEAIADALNLKFSPVQTDTQKYPGIAGLRVLYHRDDTGDGSNGFTYEVKPGRFWWARSAEDAQSETQEGWAMTEDQVRRSYKDANA